ncbi:M48 family metallopeptidase [Phaeovibrio sulfidiphilus]|uniref:M48 family metallopeptidase n=1 Tax=Phaeovibrio sulfidiphilus TaxID=1220600 RepID=A0A8J6YNF1_9PROT|nr:M48 family metallopeptidase [Phaeovibrio sulfidiphilus]MBE1237730.1 M48 family metallopeptidase [Phaeovibrio sulfidiphilus]
MHSHVCQTGTGYSRLLKLVPVVALGVFLAACQTTPYTGRSQMVFTSEANDVALGARASKEVLSTERAETGTARAKRVEAIGKKIAAVADRPNFQWEFHTIRKDVLNAFCLPGGKVFVYTGMLDFVGKDDDQLAAIMGHEIAHAIARHGAERASQAQATSIGLSVLSQATGMKPSVQKGASALAELGILLPYNRLQETEADHIGVILAAKAGYDPRAAVRLWEKMEKVGGPSGPAFLSTHPLSAQRITDLEKVMPEAMKYYEAARK